MKEQIGRFCLVAAIMLTGVVLPLQAVTIRDSDDFAVKFDGDDIWNSGFQNGWVELNGGGTTETLSGTILNYDHSGSSAATTLDGGASSLDGGTTTWDTGNNNSWTLEARLKFRANANGFALWCETGGATPIVEVYADRTQDYGNNSFNVSHDNADGAFHQFRIAWDAVAGVYHVWRDGVRLTPGQGVGSDASIGNNRLLLGDYTSSTFGDSYNVDIDYIRYDQTGVYAPPAAKLISRHFLYAYEQDVDASSQDLDGNGTADFFTGYPLEHPVVSGGIASFAEGDFYRTDFSGSIWRSNVPEDGAYSIEARLMIRTDAAEGSAGTMSIFVRDAGDGDVDSLIVRRSGQMWADGSLDLGSHDNTDGYHVFRVVRDENEGLWVYRDGVLLNPGGTALASQAMSGTYGFYFGDTSVTISGNWDLDYLRLSNSGHAPRSLMMQYGFDYTSATVAGQNVGVIEDDSGANNAGKVLYNTPTYAADVPLPQRLKDCTGIGSLDLSTGHHTVRSAATDIITVDDLVAAGGLTMEVWAKQTAYAGTAPGDTRGSGVVMTMQDAFSIVSQHDTFRIVVNSFANPSPEVAMAEETKLLRGWTHLAAVIRDFTDTPSYSGTVELWVDGFLVDSIAITTAPSLNLGRPVGLGSAVSSGSGSFRWDGFVYEPRLSLGARDGGSFTWLPPAAGSTFVFK